MRMRTPVLLVWAALLVALAGAAWLRAPSVTRPAEPTTPAGTALDRLAERIPGAADATGWVVLAAPAGASVDDPAFSAATTELVAGLRTLPGVTAVVDPGAGGTVSADRRTAFVPVAVDRGVDPAAIPLGDLLDGPRTAGLRVELGGALAVPSPTSVWPLLIVVAAGLLVAMAAAAWVLGSALGGLLAGGTGVVGSAVGTCGALLVAGPFGLTMPIAGLMFLVGVAVGLPGAVVLLAAEPSGRVTVIRGGGCAAVAAAALMATGIGSVAVVGVAAAGVIVIAVLAVLTLLPALRDVAGDRYRPPAAEGPDRWAGWVSGHALTVLSAATLALVAVIAGSAVVGSDRTPAGTSGSAEDLLASAFGVGVTGPLLLTVEVDSPASMAAALPAVAASARSTDGVAEAAPGRVSADGTLGLVTVVPATGPRDIATRELVNRLRDRSYGDGVAVQVTGAAAVAVDVADAYAAALIRYLIAAAVLVVALLFALIHPWKVAALSLTGTGLSVAATLLLVRAVVPATTSAVMAAGLLVGLILDQALRTATAVPNRNRARPIGGCALIVAAVLAGGLAGPSPLAGVAVTLVTGVLLDAIAVRLALLPAALDLLDRRRLAAPATAGSHGTRGGRIAEPGHDGRRVIEEALATEQPRRGGRHRS